MSEEVKRSLREKIQLVFVTYEMVFEYLLSEIIIGEVTPESIIRNLDLAQAKSFIQLRGAIVLALSLSLLRGDTDTSVLVELAKLNRPDSRQFLCDVIQIIYNAGRQDIAEGIVNELSEDKAIEAQLLAVQAAYQIQLDDRLVSLTLSNNPELRDLATVYVYERWNSTRLSGHVEAGYQLLGKLRSKVSLLHPKQSNLAIQALFSVNAHMFSRLIDDRESLMPLLEMYRNLVSRIPGVGKDFGRQPSSLVADGAVALIAEVVERLADMNRDLLDMLHDPATIRAVLDVGNLLALPSLTGYKNELIRLLTWDDTGVAWMASDLVMRQVCVNPNEHVLLFLEVLESQELKLAHRTLLLRALTVGMIVRSIRGLEIPDDILEILTDHLLATWCDLLEEREGNEAQIVPDIDEYWQSFLFGVLIMEADTQRRLGTTTCSRVISRLLDDSSFEETQYVEILLKTIEKTAYQGYVDFALLTLLDKNVRLHWEKIAFNIGINIFANIRAIYHQEVDRPFQSKEAKDTFGHLWNALSMVSRFPDPKDIRSISTIFWTMPAIATDITMAKATGLFLLELAYSKSVKDFWKRAVRLMIGLLFDPARIDVAHIQWGLAHDPNWNQYDALDISRDVLTIRPELHEQYRQLATQCVEKYGRGMFYGEL